MEKKQNQPDTTKLADRYFETDDYQRDDELSAGLAKTHEQVTDDYYEGTIEGKMERDNGETIDIPREGFEGVTKKDTE
ncbi:DUF4025 domain-containing protein [Bacillus lacus]|uniref:DUF4025 domain-containing protein n=1 Tax=Metabacillus lacus TaxID=1983721 RepID=A0A7X2IXN2_9BACI|nr:YozQ family protein [Metabacillus lacus]MRX71499.1 DUF4025 domain-containing protein [Metabacillus lacus]